MKKALLIAIACFTMATSRAFAGDFQQSISFTGPTDWIPDTSVTLSVFVTINYNAYGFSYWLEVPEAIAPFLSLTGLEHIIPPGPPPVWTIPPVFNSNTGARPGYRSESFDLGGTISDPQSEPPIPPGSYHVEELTLTLSAGAPLGTYTMYTTSQAPRQSIVSDTKFNDHPFSPPGQFVFNVVPEPGTLALVPIGFVGGSFLINRRRKVSP